MLCVKKKKKIVDNKKKHTYIFNMKCKFNNTDFN